ncbi:MAG: Hsp33 family molecular chaperone HslO [Clostridia bacterium]|nr:Hsp33 family molecular chaperone HslO [Clostridia bacterium]
MGTIIRGMTNDGMVKFAAIEGRDIVERARQIHQTSPVATAALGRTLLATSLLGNDLKGDGNSLTVQVRGGGPIGNIIVTSDESGNVRGYCARPQVDLPLRESDGKLDVSGAVGSDGSLVIIKDIGIGEPYVGQIELATGEIAEDITKYLAESEQVPSACALGVLVDRDYSVLAAGGYILSLMPGAEDSLITKLEENLSKCKAITSRLSEGASMKDIMLEVLDGFEVKFLEENPAEYRCYCSRERTEKVLISIGVKDLQEIRDDGKVSEVTCQFCDAVYKFTPEDIDELIKKAK